MASSPDEPPWSESHELVKLGLELTFGSRGTVAARYLDARRKARYRERLTKLHEAMVGEGVDCDDLLDRVEHDDATQELFEEVASAAQASRYDEKIRYLGKVLAAVLNGTSGAALDTAWLRLRAVRDIDAIHVQLLWLIARNQWPPWEVAAVTAIKRDATARGLDAAVANSAVGLLTHHGLIENVPDFTLEAQVEIERSDGNEAPEVFIEDVGSEVTLGWRLTPLGREVLDAMSEAAGVPPERPTERVDLDQAMLFDA